MILSATVFGMYIGRPLSMLLKDRGTIHYVRAECADAECAEEIVTVHIHM